MLRCAQSTRSNVLLKYAYARRFFARLASESFEQPANKVFNGRARVLSGLIISCIVAILVVVTSSFVISPLSAMGASPMRIGVPSPSVSYFPAVVAWKKGFFAREGIQTEFIVMKPSIIPAALTNGEIQFSTATGTIVGAALRGFPFKSCLLFNQADGFSRCQTADQKRNRFARQDRRSRRSGSQHLCHDRFDPAKT